MITSNNMCVIW